MRKTLLFLSALALFATQVSAETNFYPGETLALTTTPTPSSVTFTSPKSIASPDIMVSNAGPVTAFFGCDGSGQASLPGSGALNATAILPGAIAIFTKPRSATCAAETASGTTTLYFTAGVGQ